MLIFTFVNDHETYMWRCLDLAKSGLGQVASNPMVGAVLVYNGRIIGEGYHMKFGEAHAEVNCIDSVKKEDQNCIQESTLYISLEPCNHFGKTPPCTELILKHRIPRVVIACKDPFEKVDGAGITTLMDAGIDITFGILEREAIDLNKRFFTFHKKRRPYIILKWAQSKDKFISASNQLTTKISNDISDKLVHRWRSEEAAIIVGTNTVLADNPKLSTRLWEGKNPVRVFIDKQLRIDPNMFVLDNSISTIIFNEIENKKVGLNTYLKLHEEATVVEQINKHLYDQGITSMIVEGGRLLLQSFIDEGSWDEARVITNTSMLINHGIAAPSFAEALHFEKQLLRNDVIDYYLNNHSNSQ